MIAPEAPASPAAPGHAASTASAASAQASRVLVAVPRWFMALLLVVVTVPWLVMAIINIPHANPLAHDTSPLITLGNAGPWGDLEYTRITIAPPLEFIAEINPSPDHAWHFVGMNRQQLMLFLAPLTDLDSADRDWILQNAQPEAATNGLVVNPPDDLVRRLKLSARTAIYNLLHEWEINTDQNAAFRFGGGNLDAWLAKAPLSANTIQQVHSLAYHNGTYQFFADLHIVLPTIEDPRERSALIQTMARESTVLARLIVDDEQDVDKLVAYWGKGGRAKDVRPLLDSLARVPGKNKIDIIHLLPRFARTLFYTYPGPATEPAANIRDCHWTALNFFNAVPVDNQTDAVIEEIKNDYYPIYGNLQYGDLVLYLTKAGALYHSAVFIADDLLFTKNGARASRPWMLARMSDMKFFYPQRDGFEIRYFRKKGI
jgi:hypothetical protein